MKYPIFKENVFSYTYISAGDAFGLSKSLNSLGNPYGFSQNCNPHQMKNSEWGAVAYLTHSKYGRNGTEVTINNFYIESGSSSRPTSNSSNFCIKTGYSSTNGISGEANQTDVVLYNSGTGYLSSTTGHVYGIYDLSGGAYEYVAAYAEGLNHPGYTSGSTTYKSSQEYYDEFGSYLLSEKNLKLKNILSIDNSYSADSSKLGQNCNFLTHKAIFGDAMWEVSSGESKTYGTNWFSDFRDYPYGSSILLLRGGKYNGKNNAGIFCFLNQVGALNSGIGFRACVISPD